MNNPVGPVLRHGDDIDQIIAAIEDDNPEAEIEVIDRGAYIRIQAEDRLELTEATLQGYLGSDYRIRSLEVAMSSFSGRVSTESDRIRWETAEAATARKAEKAGVSR